jgi:hypothetical protein
MNVGGVHRIAAHTWPAVAARLPCGDAAVATPFQDGMDGDEPILLEAGEERLDVAFAVGGRRIPTRIDEDADLASGAVHLDRMAACRPARSKAEIA